MTPEMLAAAQQLRRHTMSVQAHRGFGKSRASTKMMLELPRFIVAVRRYNAAFLRAKQKSRGRW